jgi:protein SCO1
MQRITRRQLAGATLGVLAVARPHEARTRTHTSGPGARHFPNVLLRTHEDRAVRFYDDLMKGKTVLLTFMYASCEGICPGATANLKKVHERLGERAGRDVFLYSITIKPKEDTPQMLKRYAEMHDAGSGWLFLTGDPADIDLLRRALGFVDPDPVAAADATSHIGVILYGNEPLNRWAAAPALGNPEQIYRAVLWMEGQMNGEAPHTPDSARHAKPEHQTMSGETQ